jgi:hypothetical protein
MDASDAEAKAASEADAQERAYEAHAAIAADAELDAKTELDAEAEAELEAEAKRAKAAPTIHRGALLSVLREPSEPRFAYCATVQVLPNRKPKRSPRTTRNRARLPGLCLSPCLARRPGLARAAASARA